MGGGFAGMSQLAAAGFLGLLGQACNVEQPVSGPVALSAEGTTFEPPEPLRVAGKMEQKICMQIVGAATDVSFEKGAVLVNDQWHALDAEAVDDQQARYGVRLAQLGGTTACLSRPPDGSPGPDFPADRKIVKLRLSSVPPLQVEKIWWASYDPK